MEAGAPTDRPAFVVTSDADAAAIRARVQYEDGLLGSRSTLVLELNALAAVAGGLTLPAAAKTIVVIAIVALDIAWIWGARES
jgi:hypothetical protein